MDTLIPLLLLSACSSAFSEQLSAAIKRRSDRGVYASDFAREYEPIAYVAIPLHKPMPVLQILTNAPLVPQKQRRHPQPQRYPEPARYPDLSRYPEPTRYPAESTRYPPHPTERWVPVLGSRPIESQRYPQPPTETPRYGQRVYAASMAHGWYAPPNEPSTSPPLSPQISSPLIVFAKGSPSNEEPVVMYARPNKQGGYSYRKRPIKKAPPKREPYIIRVHKYRVIKDDR